MAPRLTGGRTMDTQLTVDPARYTFDHASWIAQEHATGTSLQQLHEAHPDEVPSPAIIRRWRREFPAFDLVMVEAEETRADVLADATITVADDKTITAAQARNRIQSRQWLASRLNRAKYGSTPKTVIPLNPDSGKPLRKMATYSDEDLQEIISAGLKATSIEGEVNEQATPGTPPGDERPGLERTAESDTPAPKTSQGSTSVTTNIPEEEFYAQEPDF